MIKGLRVLVLGLVLMSCGRLNQSIIEQLEGQDATTERSNVTRTKIRQFYKQFKAECQCDYRLQFVDSIRVVKDIAGPRIHGRFTDYGNGIKSIQILDKDYSDNELKHTLWHEMGHAVGKDHGDSNLIMRSTVTAEQIENIDDALRFLF